MMVRHFAPAAAVLSVAGLAAAVTGCGGDSDDVSVLPNLWEETLVRPDTPGNTLLFNFEPTDVVATHGSMGGRFLVHYTTDGPNAVPSADQNSNSVPDFVEDVAEVYEEVLSHYEGTLGFRAPVGDEAISDNGGDGRFDVYLVDFNHMGDGNYQNDSCTGQICAGFMVQENDFAGYGYPTTTMANRILGSHEFFHAVQAAYDIEQGSVMSEGTAVWGTESFDSSLPDFEYFIDGYLENPDRSLDKPMPGPVDPFSYGAAIFFQFLEEHYGAGTVLDLWERCENGANGVADPVWFEQLDPLLSEAANSSFAEAFVEFAGYNLLTDDYADPARSYANGDDYPEVAMDPEATPYVDDKMRVFYASTQYYALYPADRPAMTAAVFSPEGDPADTEGIVAFLAVRRGTSYAPFVQLTDLAAGTETVDTTGADLLVVAVINTLQAGDSRRPALCIGSPEEVELCRTNLTGAGGAGGGGGAGGAGGGSTEPPVDTDDPEGCGCRVPGGATEDLRLPLLLGLLGLALGRRRRRNSERPDPGVPVGDPIPAYS